MRVLPNTKTTQGLIVSLGIMAMLTIPARVFADVLHFHDGTILRGKLEDAAGDILDFHSGGVFGSTQTIPRLHISNRNDLVETIGHHTYYGEIVYVDSFQVDLKTTSGILKINRWKIRDIVIGTPMQQPSLPPDAAANAIQTIALPGQITGKTSSTGMPAVSHQSTITIPSASDLDDSAPALRGPTAEDGDDQAIPAVDH